MKQILLLVFASLITSSLVFAQSPATDPASFNMSAKISVAESKLSLPHGVAILEARPNTPGRFWLEIYFYSFPFTPEDISAAVKGDIKSMDEKWQEKASNPDDYNTSRAVLRLSLDKSFEVMQVDLSVPGHSCTIAFTEEDVKKFLNTYRLDGKHLTLKSKGSYNCDMHLEGVPAQTFDWDFSVDNPVFEKVMQ